MLWQGHHFIGAPAVFETENAKMALGSTHRLKSWVLCLSIALVGIGGAEKVSASPVPKSVVETEIAFDYAMAALEAGRPEAAIPVLQSILADDPKLIRVRLELARAYFMAEQWARSREEFFRVLSGDLPDPVRKTVLAFIRQIDARRGFEWDLSVGLTTAGNTRSYDSEVINLDVGGLVLPFSYNRPVERVPAVKANGRINFRRGLGGMSGANANTIGFASLGFDLLEAEGRQYDDLQLDGRLGLRLLTQNTTASIAGFGTARRYAAQHFEDQFGVEVAGERRSLLGGSAYGRLSYALVDNHLNSDFDGNRVRGMVGFRRSIGGRAVVGTELAYDRLDTDNDTHAYQTYEWSVYSTVDVRNGWTLRPRLFLRHKDFINPSAAFQADRDEMIYGGSLRVERSDLFIAGAYTPYFQIDAERGNSDIAAFSYRSVEVQIGLERRF